MKYIIASIIVISALVYFGVININKSKAEEVAKKGAEVGIELTEKGLNSLKSKVQK